MTVGPLELVVLGFKQPRFDGRIAKAIADAVDTGAVRLVDICLVQKDAGGNVLALEIDESDEAYARDFADLALDARDLLTEEDALMVGTLLPPDTAALAVVFEHTWATAISQAVADAGGEMLASHRISPRRLKEVHDAVEAVMATASAGR